MQNETGLPTASQLRPDSDYVYNNPIIGAIQNFDGYKDYRTVDPYLFLEYTYHGTKYYRDCGFLQHFARETFYQDRRKFSNYDNIFKPIIDAMVIPVYQQGVKRITNNLLYQKFLEDCDNCGTSLNKFMENAIINARLYTINFIVMESFKSDSLSAAETMKEQAESRLFPYIYERNPHTVLRHITDNHGRLLSITFADKCEEIDGTPRQYYRQWDSVKWRLFYIEKDVEITVEEDEHNFGIIPVYAISGFAISSNIKKLPTPEFYNMAVSCHSLFNKKSMVTMQEVTSTYPVFYVSGVDIKALGPTTAINCSTESKFPPGYISPPQDGIKTLIDNCQALKEEIQEQAKQSGVVGIQKAQSGIAKAYDFYAEEGTLKSTSLVGEETEKAIADMFGVLTNSEIDLICEYPKNFDPYVDVNKIDLYLKVRKEITNPIIEKEIDKDISVILWGDDSERIKTICDSIDGQATQSEAIALMKGAEEAITEEQVIE